MTTADARSHVFLRVGQWCLQLARDNSLLFWVIENVDGIQKKKRGESESFLMCFVSEMELGLGEMWRVKVVRTSPDLHGLPHHRPRIFIIGSHLALCQTYTHRRFLLEPIKQSPSPKITDFLDSEPSDDSDYHSLTENQKVNLHGYLADFAKMSNKGEVSIGITYVGRGHHLEGFSTIAMDTVATLRTNNHLLWILPSEEWKSTFGQYGRCLRRDEKARLCGLDPATLTALSQADLETALGNCIPVHMMAAVLFPVFRVFAIYAMNLPEETYFDREDF